MTTTRTALLARLPEAVKAVAAELDAAIVADRSFPVSAVRRDRASLMADTARAAALPDPAAGRAPLATGDDEVLCVLPYNIGYWAIIPVLNCLAPGNRVRLRFPRGAERTAALMMRLLQDIVGPDRVVADDRPGRELARAAADDPRVRAVCLYGSDRAGEGFREAAQAGTVVLVEGPGNDPLIVLDDAPADVAEQIIAMKFAYGSGQACVAPERVLVDERRYDEVVQQLAAAAERLQFGDPTDPRVDVGPILNAAIVRTLREQIEDALAHGAQLVAGALPTDEHVVPTVVAGLTGDMRVMTEEVFGPVLYVASTTRPEEAVALATSSPLGLSASVWGQRDAEQVARQLRGADYLEQVEVPAGGRFGVVGVNQPGHANSLHAAFGGYGRSGWVWRPGPGGAVTTWQGPKHAGHELSTSVAAP
jgi:succinate-semialdehyde dehydrogenase/glutarate-semialdehyde dehydrogenase